MNNGCVAMLLASGYDPDRRVQKEAHSLSAAGYRVAVIAWDREARYPIARARSGTGAAGGVAGRVAGEDGE